MLEYILLIIVVILAIVIRWKNRKYTKLSKWFKHDLLSIPILGVSYKFFGSDEDRMKAIQEVGEAVLRTDDKAIFIWLGHYPMLVLADPITTEYVSKVCLDKHHLMTNVGRMFLGNSSITAPVEIWRPRRKILIPTFSPRNLSVFMNVFVEQSKILAEQLKPEPDTPIPIIQNMLKYTLESVFQTTLGVQLHIQEMAELHPAVHAIETSFNLSAARLVQPWLYSDFIYKLLPVYKQIMQCKKYGSEFMEQVIVSLRKRLYEEKHNKADAATLSKHSIKSFLELLIESSSGQDKGYTDLELTEEILALILAGTETYAMGSSFIILMMARHPDVQQKLYEELKNEMDTEITAENLLRFKYLDAVVKETFRLYPPVPIVARQADKDTTLPSGVVLPKGCGIVFHLWAINRNPVYWGADAEEYRPERFLEGNLKHPAQFAPFSLGPRNCVGSQYALNSTKTAIITLLRHYRVKPADPNKPLRLKFGITMKDVDDFKVKLERRV